MKGISHDTYTVYTWLQENGNKFQSPIFGPPMIECSIKDDRYADQIENFFGYHDKLAFTCTNQEDFRKFSKLVFGDRRTGDKGLGVRDVTVKMVKAKLEEHRPALSEEEVSPNC